MTKDNILRRISVLEKTIRPKNSLSARVAKLLPQDRVIYENYKKAHNEWCENHPGEEAYINLLQHIEGNTPTGYPQDLPRRIQKLLYPESEPSLETDSSEEITRKYYNFLEAIK